MSPEKLNEFMKSQMAGANRLQGPLFDVMRQIMGEATTVELKVGVLDFLKKYNDMSSGKHILENIKGTLEDIEARMFRNDREGLQRLAMRLKPHSTDSNAANVRMLKDYGKAGRCGGCHSLHCQAGAGDGEAAGSGYAGCVQYGAV